MRGIDQEIELHHLSAGNGERIEPARHPDTRRDRGSDGDEPDPERCKEFPKQATHAA